MRKSVCRSPGCHALLDQPGYCPAHKYQEPVPFEHMTRANEFLYKTKEWRHLREGIIKIRECCELCGSTERLEVHHKTPPRGDPRLFFDRTNLLVVCHKCHNTLTSIEINQRRRGRK